MIPIETLRDLFDYNYWARYRQLNACAALSERPSTSTGKNGCRSSERVVRMVV